MNGINTNFGKPSLLYYKELSVILATCTLCLWLKFFLTIMIGARKSKNTGNRTKEDNEVFMVDKNTATEEAKEEEIRWWYIELNDMESIPWALIMFWGAKVIISEADCRLALCVFVPVYTLARILHTYFFASGKFLPRGISHLTAVACVLGAGITMVVDAFMQL